MVSEPAIRHLKIAFPVQGIVMQLTQMGGGRHKTPVLWALVIRLETYRLRRFRPRPPQF